MNRLYRFTNRHGRVNHGIVTEHLDDGVNVIFDAFDVEEQHSLPARYGYVCLSLSAQRESATTEILPLTDDVVWQDERLQKVATMVLAGTFESWWERNAADVRAKLFQMYED